MLARKARALTASVSSCSLSHGGKCQNPIGTAPPKIKEEKTLICPFSECAGGQGGRPVTIRLSDFSRFRAHVSEHCAEGVVPSTEWLASHEIRMCPNCSKAVTSMTQLCVNCKKIVSVPRRPPRGRR